MKRILTAVMLCACASALAQTLDTVYDRLDDGFYSQWFDTCPDYLKGGQGLFMQQYLTYPNVWAHDINGHALERRLDSVELLVQYHTSSPMAVKGAAVMVAPDDELGWWMRDPDRLPEYVTIGYKDPVTQRYVPTDSVRWDTLAPSKIHILNLLHPGLFFSRASLLYMVEFDRPVMVSDTFYLGLTCNSNESDSNYGQAYFIHKPTIYKGVHHYHGLGHEPCHANTLHICNGFFDSPNHIEQFLNSNTDDHAFGCAIPLVDKYNIELVSSNDRFGTFLGGGRQPQNTYQVFEACPEPGCTFLQWDDGSTENPRTIFLTSDTLFTALFASSVCHITATSADSSMGHVFGSGTYYGGTPIRLEACPDSGFVFDRWQDNQTDNPRYLTVAQDSLFIAYFREFVPEEDPVYFQIQALSSDESLGTVSGGGAYLDGATALLEAIPEIGCMFTFWQDSVMDNPRQVVVTQDSVFTALFLPQQGVASAQLSPLRCDISPNPAKDRFTLTIGSDGESFRARLRLVDASGKVVLATDIDSPSASIPTAGLAAGVYYLLVETPQASALLKVVVE